MHYKNGREAKVGDIVVYEGYLSGIRFPVTGVLIQVTPGTGTCDGMVTPITNSLFVTLGDILHNEDAVVTHKEK